MYFPGSLLLMEGAVQEDWLHCLPKVEKNACSLPSYFCEIAGPALQGGEGEPDLQDDVQCRPCVLEAPDDIKLVQYRSPCMHFAQVSQCPSRGQSTQKALQNFSLISIQHKSVPCWLNGPFYTWHWDTWLLTRDCDERERRMGSLKTIPPLLRVVSIVKFELCQQWQGTFLFV